MRRWRSWRPPGWRRLRRARPQGRPAGTHRLRSPLRPPRPPEQSPPTGSEVGRRESTDSASGKFRPSTRKQQTVDDSLRVTDDIEFPAAALMWRFGPSGGPGGQHANRAHTRVELGIDLVNSTSIPSHLRVRVLDALESRLVDGELWVVVDETRSQWRNRQLARRRMRELIEEAAKPPAPPRRPTKPSRSAKRRRLDAKRRRSEVKRSRRRPDID